MKKKIPYLQMTRHVIQLISFLLFPGLFIATLAAIKSIIVLFIEMKFDLSSYLAPMLTLAVTIIPTIIFGRFFCGFLCSFGAMQDLIYKTSGLVIKDRITFSKKTDQILKYLKYLILIVLIFVWAFGIETTSVSPWHVFGTYISLSGWSDLSTFITIGGWLLLLIIIASLFIERFFCRYLCPLGGIYTVLSRFRLIKIQKPTRQCGKCHYCETKCAMNIDMSAHDVITDGECIDCFMCKDVCPRDNITTNPKPALATGVSVLAIGGLYYGGNLASSSLGNATTVTQGQFSNGTYTGSAQGFRGETSVKVVVKNNSISSIEVTSYQDDEQFFNQAKNTIISNIISSQSTDVDTVSGATYSSNGLINAVKNALSSKSGETSNNESENNSEENSTLKDGTYTGSGNGFRGETQVKVVVKNKKISSIEITSYQDDEQFFERAKETVIANIIKSSSIDVDTVSGATFSSNGIKEAVANALNIDFTNPNSSSPSQGHHHH